MNKFVDQAHSFSKDAVSFILIGIGDYWQVFYRALVILNDGFSKCYDLCQLSKKQTFNPRTFVKNTTQ